MCTLLPLIHLRKKDTSTFVSFVCVFIFQERHSYISTAVIRCHGILHVNPFIVESCFHPCTCLYTHTHARTGVHGKEDILNRVSCDPALYSCILCLQDCMGELYCMYVCMLVCSVISIACQTQALLSPLPYVNVCVCVCVCVHYVTKRITVFVLCLIL